MNFQRGQVVKVLSGAEQGQLDETEGFDNYWVSEMTANVGKTFEVLEQTGAGVMLRDHPVADYCYYYPPAVLQAVA